VTPALLPSDSGRNCLTWVPAERNSILPLTAGEAGDRDPGGPEQDTAQAPQPGVGTAQSIWQSWGWPCHPDFRIVLL
jgi:hypothetical protein